MSMLFEHMTRYYKELDNLATNEEQEGGHVLRIFRGKVVSVYRSLEIAQSYYSKVRTSLINMGCMTILQQGARGTESVIVLHHPPDRDEFRLLKDEPGLTPRLDSAILAQRIADIEKQLGGLNVVEALSDIMDTVRTLEREVERIGKTPPKPARRV